jgi:23S rRNA G2069 N7-methylase RlmK/C1962 C5-methylase RlmI
MSDTLDGLCRVVLKRGRSKPFWLGHPWVFSGGIHKVEGSPGEMGGPCVVVDERGNVLGSGHYNPHSQIAVRILQHRRSTDLSFSPLDFETLLTTRVKGAVARRVGLGLPGEGLDVYRLVNSEGDGLSGLIVDRFGYAVIAHLGSRAMYDARELVANVLRQVLDPEYVIVAVSETASRLEAIPVQREVTGRDGAPPTAESVIAQEHGIRYQIPLVGGQKTGFYADQRENRRRFARLCEGRSVLDAYCYMGGFGLSAAKANARSVTFVDTSAPAVAALRQNISLNEFSTEHEVFQEDAVAFFKEMQARDRRWERIVVDPPKLARGRGHLRDALKKYARINTLAMDSLESGGLLLSCSCSQHVSQEAFLRMLTEAGHRLRRNVYVHEVWTQGADHPFSVVANEGQYLKAVLLSVTDG